jgi:hypothetical protein
MSAGKDGAGYTVGITIFVMPDGKLGLYENGLRQNVLFLYRLFRASPNCRAVYLLNHGDGELAEDARAYGVEPHHILRTRDLKQPLDYAIVLGAAMDKETVRALRQSGTRLICYKGGNGAVISMEAMAAVPPRGDAERYFDRDCYDLIWMTPQHIRTYKPWCETLHRCPVVEVPQIWEPLMIEAMPPDIRQRFGYRRGKRPWRFGILDPNVTIMKTSHMPMLVAEAAFRRDRSRFAAVYVTNGLAHKDNAHFVSFAAALSAYRAGIMTLEPRFVGPQFIANHADAIVTHHWENALNYLYYEALYGGYPLIHNSEMLAGYGYGYESFDAESGADALARAHERHDDEFGSYYERNAALFERLNPATPATIALHESLLPA